MSMRYCPRVFGVHSTQKEEASKRIGRPMCDGKVGVTATFGEKCMSTGAIANAEHLN